MSQDIETVRVQILDKDYQVACPAPQKEGLLEAARYLDQQMRAIRQSGKVIGVELPQFVEMEVTQVDPGSRGDTASGRVLKEARVASGATVRVPLYLEPGEMILVDTRTGEFVKRAKG